MLDFIGMWEQAKNELEGMWDSLDVTKSAAQASDAIKRAAGTPENANMVAAIEKARKGAEPVVLAPPAPIAPQPVTEELDLFEDTTSDNSVIPAEEASVLAPQGETTQPPATSPRVITPPVQDVEVAVVEEETVAEPEVVDVTLTGWSNLAGLESADNHVDSIGIFTMPYGVVADGGITLSGKKMDVKKDHNLTKDSTFENVDTSKAYKKVDGTTYKRQDYTSDELFSKAIYSGFYGAAKKSVSGFDKLTDEQVEIIVDIGYNAGPKAYKWNDIDTLSTELQKKEADRTITNLTEFTKNFAASSKFGAGLLRRRSVMANKVLGDTDQIAYIEQGNDVEGTTTFSMKRSDGTTVRSWDKSTTSVNAYPTGKPVITIDGERKASY